MTPEEQQQSHLSRLSSCLAPVPCCWHRGPCDNVPHQRTLTLARTAHCTPSVAFMWAIHPVPLVLFSTCPSGCTLHLDITFSRRFITNSPIDGPHFPVLQLSLSCSLPSRHRLFGFPEIPRSLPLAFYLPYSPDTQETELLPAASMFSVPTFFQMHPPTNSEHELLSSQGFNQSPTFLPHHSTQVA